MEPPVLVATLNAFLRTRVAEEEREKLLVSEKAAREEAKRANRLKDDFLATLSHELRTPLNSIVGWSQLLRRGPADAEELAEGLEAIERNAMAQSQLISDLLDISRITSGKLRLDIQPIDPAVIIDNVLDTIKHAALAKHIKVSRVVEAPVYTILGDPGRIQQVIWNLINNAVKFTHKGGNIVVTLQRKYTHLEIRVRDNGEGIGPELLPHIFERFQQGDASTTRTHGGLGLGLSIVKQLVEMHGGTVSAESAGLKQGSCFTVILPIAPVDAIQEVQSVDMPTSPAVRGSSKIVAPDMKGVRVLVVDDDADGRALVRRVLRDSGATVLAVADVPEALSQLKDFAPHVLLSDIGMPMQDGYDLIKQVRARGFSAASLPAVALTAFARTEDRQRAMLAGYQVHIAKPVDANELIATVAMLAGRTALSS